MVFICCWAGGVDRMDGRVPLAHHHESEKLGLCQVLDTFDSRTADSGRPNDAA